MDEVEPVKPWRWPGRWLTQESFWRDVASRSLSGLFVLVFGYAFAVVAGYVKRPNVWPVIAFLIATMVPTTVYAWLTRNLVGVYGTPMGGLVWPLRILGALAVCAISALLLWLVFA